MRFLKLRRQESNQEPTYEKLGYVCKMTKRDDKKIWSLASCSDLLSMFQILIGLNADPDPAKPWIQLRIRIRLRSELAITLEENILHFIFPFFQIQSIMLVTTK